MKKLLTLVLALALLCTMGLTAFAEEPVTITYWSMWNEAEPQGQVISEAAAAYETETGVHVNIEWKGRDINQLLSAALDAGEAFDLFDDDYNRVGQVYAPHTYDLTAMADAAGYADKSFAIFSDQAIAWAGNLNSIAEQPQIGGVFYDKDAFATAGIEAVPTTWAEFLDCCEKLKAAGIAPLAQDSAYTNFSFYYHLVRYIGEDGIAALRDNGGWADNEGAVKAAQDIIDLVNAGYLVDGAPDEYPASQNKIGFGLAAMVVCANYVTAEVDNNTGTKVNWGWFNYPAVDGGAEPTATYVGANSLAITSYSEHPQEAFDFIMYLVTGAVDQQMADTIPQIPADPNNTAPSTMEGTVEVLLENNPMSWCGSLNTHPAWSDMKSLFTELFEGKYATGADFCAAMDALY